MRIKICTDSTCDLGEQLIKEHDISISPLSIIKNGQGFTDMVDITPADIVAHVDAGGSLCSTSAVNIGAYAELFRQLSPEYDAVIEITLGRKFSSCYQNACEAAAGFANVYVVDSGNLSTGNGLMVMEAVRLRQSGLDAQTIVKELENTRDRVETSFVLSQLEYMRKGGRCSAVALLGANLLKIKPSIKVSNGEMGVAEKYRGSFAKCLQNYVKTQLEGRKDICDNLIFITYSQNAGQYVELVENEVKKYQHFDNIVHTCAGCTITCHCGPGCLGILFIRKPD